MEVRTVVILWKFLILKMGNNIESTIKDIFLNLKNRFFLVYNKYIDYSSSTL